MSNKIIFLLTLFGLLLHLNLNAQEDGNVQFKPINTGDYDGSVLLPRPVQKVVIDAGHGGRDEGAQGNNSMEKHINLAISQKLGEKIKAGFPGVSVVYTRRSDISLSLPERAEIANVQQGDLLISIHCNALRQKKVQGTEIYVIGDIENGQVSDVFQRENKLDSPDDMNKLQNYGDAFQGYSLEFAHKINRELRDFAGRKSLGVKREPFIVLRASNMPGVLIEAGFLTNKNDERFLLSDAGQGQVAEAIYRAFSEYKTENDAVTTSFVPTKPVQNTPPPSLSSVATSPVEITVPPKVVVANAPSIAPTPRIVAPAPRPAIVSSPFKRGISRVDLPQREMTDNVMNDLREKANYNADADYIPQFRTEYKVQLLILSDQLDKSTPPWNDVFHLDIEQFGAKFSYLATGYWDYESAVKGQNYWRTNGFPDATIITYKKGQRQ